LPVPITSTWTSTCWKNHIVTTHPKYWDSRKLSPSSLLFYIGLNKKVEGIQHHNLFFDADFEQHAKQIYTSPQWPDEPLFYVCCPSKTDAA
jgi:phytoene desaturase